MMMNKKCIDCDDPIGVDYFCVSCKQKMRMFMDVINKYDLKFNHVDISKIPKPAGPLGGSEFVWDGTDEIVGS